MVEGVSNKLRTALMCFLYKWLRAKGNKLNLDRNSHLACESKQFTVSSSSSVSITGQLGTCLSAERVVPSTQGDLLNQRQQLSAKGCIDQTLTSLHVKQQHLLGRRCVTGAAARHMDNGKKLSKAKPHAGTHRQPATSRSERTSSKTKSKRAKPDAETKSRKNAQPCASAGACCTADSRRHEATEDEATALSVVPPLYNFQFTSHVKNSADGERGYQYSCREVDNANMWDRHVSWMDNAVPPNEYPFNHIDQQRLTNPELELLQRRDSAPPPYLLSQRDRLVRPPSYDTLVSTAFPSDAKGSDSKHGAERTAPGSR